MCRGRDTFIVSSCVSTVKHWALEVWRAAPWWRNPLNTGKHNFTRILEFEITPKEKERGLHLKFNGLIKVYCAQTLQNQ